MRTSILRLKHEYVTKLLLKIVRLITETINGGNKYLAIRYARIGVVDYSMEILKYGFSDEEVKSLDKFNSKIVLKQVLLCTFEFCENHSYTRRAIKSIYAERVGFVIAWKYKAPILKSL